MAPDPLAPPSRTIDATAVLSVYFGLTLLIPSQSVIAPLGTIGAPSTLLAMGALVWWLWDHLHRRSPGQQRPQLVRAAALTLILVMFLVYRHALMQPMVVDEVTPADSGLIRFIATMGIVLTASDGITSMERLQVLVRRMTWAVGAVSALALLQIVTGQAWIDRISIPGLSTSGTAGELITRGEFLRPSGTSVHPIEFGAVLAVMLPVMISHARTTSTHRHIAWGSVALAAAAVLMSVSRTALICSFLGVLILLPAWSWRARGRALVVGVLGLAVASVAVPGLIGTLRGLFLGSDNDPSVQSRTAGYTYAAEMFFRSPWLGRGYGTFLPRYYIFDNGYLQFTMDAGAVGLLLLLTLFVVACYSASRASRAFTRTADREIARGFYGAVVAGAVSVAFFDLFAFPQSASSLALAVGLCGATYRLARSGDARSDPLVTDGSAGGGVAVPGRGAVAPEAGDGGQGEVDRGIAPLRPA